MSRAGVFLTPSPVFEADPEGIQSHQGGDKEKGKDRPKLQIDFICESEAPGPFHEPSFGQRIGKGPDGENLPQPEHPGAPTAHGVRFQLVDPGEDPEGARGDEEEHRNGKAQHRTRIHRFREPAVDCKSDSNGDQREGGREEEQLAALVTGRRAGFAAADPAEDSSILQFRFAFGAVCHHSTSRSSPAKDFCIIESTVLRSRVCPRTHMSFTRAVSGIMSIAGIAPALRAARPTW